MNNLTACIFNIQKYSIHDGPGIRTVVFFKGCPLKCLWCSNPESQYVGPEVSFDQEAQPKSALTIIGDTRNLSYIMSEVMKDKDFYDESGGGVTLSGGEAMLQYEFAIALLKQFKDCGIHTACETTGYATQEIFQTFIENVDLILFDIKHYDSQKHYEYTNVYNEKIIQNLKTAIRQGTDVIVRIPVIPGINSSLKDAQGFCDLLKAAGATKVNLLPFHQFGQKKYSLLNKEYKFKDVAQLHEEDLINYKEIFKQNGLNCTI
ncbi:glycyl-radical enzyme activating protein [Clostridium lacusfryxellense]|uniref:glycyl-radical enzyme activating protein n=1 Tax=Clostridium lacusfryxellense TaxID=205328 RepID=UPI001C0C339E|nr:glycyl-radical enzyme activating protein [Clostridium lacusfryxellense]MBU3113757.1 glycyl-radical enzyme activating protein [Clostridium lacusfryxellense]